MIAASAPLYSGRCIPADAKYNNLSGLPRLQMKSRSESVLRWSGKSAVFGLAAVAFRIKA